jgi:hypothetical protein
MSVFNASTISKNLWLASIDAIHKPVNTNSEVFTSTHYFPPYWHPHFNASLIRRTSGRNSLSLSLSPAKSPLPTLTTKWNVCHSSHHCVLSSSFCYGPVSVIVQKPKNKEDNGISVLLVCCCCCCCGSSNQLTF